MISCFTKIFASAYVYFALVRVTETSHKDGINDIMLKSTSCLSSGAERAQSKEDPTCPLAE